MSTHKVVIMALTVLLLLLACLPPCTEGITLPGLAATAYKEGSAIRAEVNDVRSVKNPVQFDFYSKRLPYHLIPFTRPKGFSSSFDLGAILSGERHQWSPYVFNILNDECVSLAETKLNKAMQKRLLTLIKRRYRVQMVVDGLPAINNGTSVLRNACTREFYKSWPRSGNYLRGYYIGVPAKCTGFPLLNNHVHFKITLYPLDKEEAQYFEQVTLRDNSVALRQKRRVRAAKKGSQQTEDTEKLYLIVAVTVVPYSIDWSHLNTMSKSYVDHCPAASRARLDIATTDKAATSKTGRLTLPHEAMALGVEEEELEDETDFDTPADDDEDDVNPDFWDDDDPEAEEDDEDEMDPEDENDPGFTGEEEDDMEEEVEEEVEENAAGGEGEQKEKASPQQKPVDGNYPRTLQFLKGVDNEGRQKLPVRPADAISVRWSYSVEWKVSKNIKWATRWDAYFKNHPFTVKQSSYMLSILLSSAVIAALLSLVITVLVRTLRRDLLMSAPIFLSPEDERVAKEEENGWKSVRGDVFRPPPRANLLAVAASAGAQTLLTVFFVVLFGMLGFAAPSNRGAMASLLLFFFLLSSFAGGAFCAWLSLALGQPKRWMTIGELLLGFSGLLLATFTCANIVLRFAGSSGALPVMPMVTLYTLWLLVYCPLGFLGAVAGFATHYKPTERVAAVQRVIDYSKVWSLFRPPALLWYSGLPSFFVGIFLLKIIFNGIWGGVMLYVFGFVCITGGLWVVSCGLTSVAVVYYNLCGENHRWHWLSFVAPTSAGLPPALFVLWYFIVNMRSTALTAILIYFIYTGLFTILYTVVGGAIGFLSSFVFVCFIYNSAKRD